MPMAAKRPCSAPGCANLYPCTTHARQRERLRNASPDRTFYGKERWLKLRKWFRDQYKFCGMRADGLVHQEHRRQVCREQGDFVLAGCVDHIVPVTKGGDKYDVRNLQSLCIPCNTAKGNR